jgi:type II secretory pathway pseudopilin PulG
MLIALLAILIIGVLVSALSGKSSQNQFDEKTLPVLAVAQKALIAYAAGNRVAPGRLPCPDTDNDGVEDCPPGPGAPNQLGRLPWKTLGMADLRDGSGECLWYAASGAFMQTSSLTTPVNSDTPGQFTIKDDAGVTLATGVIAVVIAPGPPLPGNDRTQAGTTQCGGNTTASNYLDTSGAVNNAVSPPATFVAGQPSGTFNDRVVFITPAQFFPPVERRVAGEMRQKLLSYYGSPGNNFYFPFANDYLDASYNCTPSLTRGRLPVNISAGCPALPDWPTALPGWFINDQWNLLTYYTVAPACTSATPACTGAGYLTVNNAPAPNNNKEALVIAAGRRLGAQVRPCTAVADCLDGVVNTSGTDTYEIRPPSPTFDDTVVVVAP